MRAPILFALTWPERLPTILGRLDLTRVQQLTFSAPDLSEFPCLAYALEVARIGGTAPALLNAANEIAVEAFCRRRIPFLAISDVVRGVLDACPVGQDTSLDSVLAADTEGRHKAAEVIRRWSG
jgi:1-deoxy-D-xylulose-5-phosphate reductoisomerase